MHYTYVVVLDGERETPLPWSNVLANPQFGSIVSSSGSAFTWAGNSRENRLTPFANDPLTDPTAEAIYLRDEDSGAVWGATPGPLPRRPVGRWVVRHGAGVTRYQHAVAGLEQELTVCVAPEDPVKLTVLTVTNTSKVARRLSVFGYVEWCLGPPRAGERRFVVTEMDRESGTLSARNAYNTEFGDAVAFLRATVTPHSHTGDRLQRQGLAVPLHVEPPSSLFGPGSVLFFHTEASTSSTDFSSETAFELVRAPSGPTMGVVTAAPSGAPPAPSSTGSSSFETERIYQPGLLDAPDPWLWEALWGGVSRTRSFPLRGVDASSAKPARLVVIVQGGSDAGGMVDHHLFVFLNGIPVGETSWDGKAAHRFETTVPASLLREGSNDLTVDNAGDTGVYSLAFLDEFSLAFLQAPSAREGLFEGTWGNSDENLNLAEVHQGIYISDIAGMISLFSDIQDKISVIANESVKTLKGINSLLEDKTFIEGLRTSIINLNNVTVKLDRVITENQQNLKEITESTKEITVDTKNLIKENKDKVEVTLTNLNSVMLRSDSLLTSLNYLTNETMTGGNNLGKILYNDSLYNNLIHTMESINELTKILKDQKT